MHEAPLALTLRRPDRQPRMRCIAVAVLLLQQRGRQIPRTTSAEGFLPSLEEKAEVHAACGIHRVASTSVLFLGMCTNLFTADLRLHSA